MIKFIIVLFLTLSSSSILHAENKKPEIRGWAYTAPYSKKIMIYMPSSYELNGEQTLYGSKSTTWGHKGSGYDLLNAFGLGGCSSVEHAKTPPAPYKIISQDSTLIIGYNELDTTYCIIRPMRDYNLVLMGYRVRPNNVKLFKSILIKAYPLKNKRD